VHAIAAPPSVSSSDRLGMTIFVAVVAHLLVILGVTFTKEDRGRSTMPTLDVVLVQSRTEAPPEDAKLLAQASQDGGGTTDKPKRPATPLVAPFAAPTPVIAALPATQLPRPEVPTVQLEAMRDTPAGADPVPPKATPKPVVAQRNRPARQKAPLKPEFRTKVRELVAKAKALKPPEPRPVESPSPAPPPSPAQTVVNASQLINRSLAMASLRATIDQQMKAYAQRPRRKWITARTREHKFAAYMEAWRAKVERIGNLNYPDEARRRRLSGNLLLDVALNQDGTINDVVLRRSSGKRVLDDAAVRIVKLAAPYGKFPANIAQEVDILHIQRTWQFSTNNRFASR